MIERTKESWRRFRASTPGHRFQDRYRRRQESEHGWRDPRKLFYVVGGLIIALGSLVFGVLPGPGTLTFFVGLGMIGGEFRPRRPFGSLLTDRPWSWVYSNTNTVTHVVASVHSSPTKLPTADQKAALARL